MADAGNTADSTANDNPLTALDQQIKAHREADENRSWIGYMASQVWRGDRTTLADLEKLSTEARDAQQRGDTTRLTAMSTDMREKIQADQKALGTQEEIGFYTSSGLKMAGLFVGGGRFSWASKSGLIGMEGAGTMGWLGMASTVGIHAADKAKMGDSGSELLSHLALGAGQGLATKSLFNGIGSISISETLKAQSLAQVSARALANPLEKEALTNLAARSFDTAVGKGLALGTVSRGTELTFNTNSYKDTQSGEYSLTTGLKNIVSGTLDPKAMAIDGVMFGLTNSFANVVTGGAAARPFYHTVLTSGTLGLGSGAYGAIEEQWKSGNPIDWHEVARKTLLQGAVYAVAGVPGGLAADHAFRARPMETIKSDVSRGMQQTGQELRGMAAALVPSVDMLGMRPAYAMAAGNIPGAAPRRIESRMPNADLNGPQVMAMQGDMFGGDVKFPAAGQTGRAVETAPDSFVQTRARAEQSLTAEQLRTNIERTDELLTAVRYEHPTVDDHAVANTFFAAHPEVDARVLELYMQHADNPALRRMVDGFYRPPGAMEREVGMLPPDVVPKVSYVVRWLENVDPIRSEPSVVARNLRKYMDDANTATGIDIRPAIEQLARTTNNQRLAGIIDGALSGPNGPTTNYQRLLTDFADYRRSLPLTRDQVRMLENPNWSPSRPAEMGAVGLALMDAVGGVARAVPGVDGMVGGEATAARAATPAAARNATVDNAIAVGRARMESTDPAANRAGMASLSRHLGHPEAGEWFAAWKQKLIDVSDAPSATRGLFNSPEIQALPEQAVREFLAGDWSAATKPESSVAGMMVAKLGALRSVGALFQGEPAVVARLAELGKNDPVSFAKIPASINSGKKGALNQEFKDWLIAQLPEATSLTPLVGDPGLVRMQIAKALPDQPDLARNLLERADQDPKFNLKELVFKMGNRAIGETVRKLVQEKVEAGAPNAQLDPNYLAAVADLPRTFGNKETGERLLELAKDQDPQAVVDITGKPVVLAPQKGGPKAGPRPMLTKEQHGINDRYLELTGELVRRADNLDDVKRVTSALKGRNPNVADAEAAMHRLIPPGDPMYDWATQALATVALKNAAYNPGRYVPPAEPAESAAPAEPAAAREPAASRAPAERAGSAEDISLGEVPGADAKGTPEVDKGAARPEPVLDEATQAQARAAAEAQQKVDSALESARDTLAGELDADYAAHLRDTAERSTFDEIAMFRTRDDAELFADHAKQKLAAKFGDDNVTFSVEPYNDGQFDGHVPVFQVKLPDGQQVKMTPLLNEGKAIDRVSIVPDGQPEQHIAPEPTRSFEEVEASATRVPLDDGLQYLSFKSEADANSYVHAIAEDLAASLGVDKITYEPLERRSADGSTEYVPIVVVADAAGVEGRYLLRSNAASGDIADLLQVEADNRLPSASVPASTTPAAASARPGQPPAARPTDSKPAQREPAARPPAPRPASADRPADQQPLDEAAIQLAARQLQERFGGGRGDDADDVSRGGRRRDRNQGRDRDRERRERDDWN